MLETIIPPKGSKIGNPAKLPPIATNATRLEYASDL
jgi:hypothetical protein